MLRGLLLAALLAFPFPAHAAFPQQVAASARWFAAKRPKLQKNDCSGLVKAILARAGARVEGNARTMWAEAKRDGRVVTNPRPGDLVFFDYTYDKNRNGRVDDALTHIGVVTAVAENGTVSFVHKGSKGITTLRLNRARRAVHKDGKRVLNDFLRARDYGPRNGPRLAGQLLRGYARSPGVKRVKRRKRAKRPKHAKRSVFD